MPSPSFPATLRLLKSVAHAQAVLNEARTAGKRVGLVPTMGALHAGHASLVDAARRECDFVVATIFVNPTQFGPNEDFSKYPRTFDTDLKLLQSHGTNVVFAPETTEVYRPGHSTYITVEGISGPLEGAIRPEHFRGVATIVLKLFNMVPADVAFFGQKDYQQSLVIRRMVADLNVPIEVRVCPTVREADGLAMSSRNVYLSASERLRARVLSRSLRLAAELVERGERNAKEIMQQMQAQIKSEDDVALDYVIIADTETLAPVEHISGPVVALIAARIGTTRLIDNAVIQP